MTTTFTRNVTALNHVRNNNTQLRDDTDKKVDFICHAAVIDYLSFTNL